MQRQIVIVTRDSQFRDALKRVCSGQGDRVETADSIATALKIAAQIPVCVTIADVTIQTAGDGVRLARVIHTQNPDVKCFLIVDDGSADIASSARNEPWQRFIHKPISMLQFAADLVDAVSESKVAD
ncbi:MAG: response regulator [Planctomycetaceae bacterium]|jgi:DNA-binding NtrC family response regulator|nr:response regulator [Planctomycetaceae bacterium]MBT6484013.1 response regulator [Planctomycetaceae bacterium]MBT6495482.1 response regulator [Planctomycetaceae bacterium]